MKIIRNNNLGITIVSLAVTVVVLIILAGITINGLLGDGGIIDTAKEQKDGLELEQEYLANELAEYKSALAQEQGTTQYIPGENDYEQLNKSDFIGMHSSQEPGEESTYTVKSIKTGYVPSGMIVHDSLVSATSPTIETTGDTGVQIINIKPGYYHKISVNQTNAYNDGYEKAKVGNAKPENVLAGKTFTNSTTVGATGTMVDKSGKTTDAIASQSGNYIRMQIPTTGYYDTSSYVRSAASDFGDAAATEVLDGKYFTSTAGLKVKGTMPKLTSSNFTGTHSSTTAGAASNYTVKSSIAGYVASGTQVNIIAAKTSDKIDTTAGTGEETINIVPGYYNKIKVDRTAAYEKGKSDATFDFNGDAAVGDVLSGKKFYSNSGTIKTGTMPDLNASSIYQHTSTNTTKLIVGDAAFQSTAYNRSTNTDSGTYISIRYNGTEGYLKKNTLVALGASAFGNAAAKEVLSGKTFTSSAGLKVSGSMPNNTVIKSEVGIDGNVPIPAGYYASAGYVNGPTLTGNAAAGDVLSGKTFYSNNGSKKTGSLPNYSNDVKQYSISAGTGVQEIDIDDGYHTKIKIDRSAAYNAGVSSIEDKFLGSANKRTLELSVSGGSNEATTGACAVPIYIPSVAKKMIVEGVNGSVYYGSPWGTGTCLTTWMNTLTSPRTIDVTQYQGGELYVRCSGSGYSTLRSSISWYFTK